MNAARTHDGNQAGIGPAALTPKEFDILRTLADNPDHVFSREELLSRVWGTKPAARLATRTVDRYVEKLWQKLGPVGTRLVTAKPAGYGFGKD